MAQGSQWRSQLGGIRGWFSRMWDRIANSFTREMGIVRDGNFTRQDAGNLAQSLLTAGLTGTSGRIYDFNNRRFMQGFNPLEGIMGGRGPQPTGVNAWGPTQGAYSIRGNRMENQQAPPLPSFTQWGQPEDMGGRGVMADPEQIYQGPPEELAGSPRSGYQLTRAQQEGLLEMGRAEASQRRMQELSREMMSRMFEGKIQ